MLKTRVSPIWHISRKLNNNKLKFNVRKNLINKTVIKLLGSVQTNSYCNLVGLLLTTKKYVASSEITNLVQSKKHIQKPNQGSIGRRDNLAHCSNHAYSSQIKYYCILCLNKFERIANRLTLYFHKTQHVIKSTHGPVRNE